MIQVEDLITVKSKGNILTSVFLKLLTPEHSDNSSTKHVSCGMLHRQNPQVNMTNAT